MAINAEEGLLTAQEVADYLGLKRQTIYNRLCNDPSFPRVKVGGSVRFRLKEIESWIQRQNEERAA